MLPLNAIAGPVNPTFPTSPFNKIVFVGEAPGQVEAILKTPFVGPAGALFTEILRKANIDRQSSLICNAFRYQPTWSADENGKRRNNDITQFFATDPANGDKNIPPYRSMLLLPDYVSDIDFLFQTISAWNPQKIIALGSIALWALTGSMGIRDNRGKIVHSVRANKPVYPTFHPAYALHSGEAEHIDTIVADIVRAIS